MDLFTKQYHAPGTLPGTLNIIEDDHISLTLFDYNENQFIEKPDISVQECRSFIDKPNTTWIHIQGAPTLEMLNVLSSSFGLHDLYLEDIVNVGQRPKVEILDNQIFLILSLPAVSDNAIAMEQVSLFLSERTVISFCTGDTIPFDLVIERLRKLKGKVRKRQADYLFYTLIDTVVDYGYPLLEYFSEKIQTLEDTLMDSPDQTVMQSIHQLRRELLLSRRRLWPQRELINQLIRDDSNSLIKDETYIYLRDCYDHVITVIELLETYHEISSGMLEVYLSSVSYRLNEVMRILTIIATLFIPPTFIVGVYGMNFDRNVGPLNMPELGWPYGYLFVWGVILSMTAGMLFYFYKKKWF
ncbi:MAG: magnesium transporter [Cellvibrionaceae bacterium]|jgi:magnesium transporter